ncbi:MAG TPA: hypothetical protein VM841_08125 [Actinomycetota bacterium]|nr:hypothetical protein [Actinomycetota bacterium]
MGNIEINAFQRSANVIVQKSLGEGFGLTVAEARWKSKPVGGSCGDLRAQDRRTGYLVNVEECAGRAVTLLHDSTATAEMGAAGREVVRERLLSPRDIDDFSEMLEVLS